MKSVGSHGRYVTAVHDEGNDGITLSNSHNDIMTTPIVLFVGQSLNLCV